MPESPATVAWDTHGDSGNKCPSADDALAEAAADDPDAEPLDLANAAVVIPPRKVAISIRPDQDVLDHVKRDGAGYRTSNRLLDLL